MTYAIPTGLAYVVDDRGSEPVVFLLHLPDGEPVALTGSSALIWMAAATGTAAVAEVVRPQLSQPPADLDGHVSEFLTTLVADGLLAPA